MAKKIVSRCPFCSGSLRIARLECEKCDTSIESQLTIPQFFRLPADLQDFVFVFLGCRGNIREVEKKLGISYPTVCKKLDLVNKLLGERTVRLNPHKVLEQIERGEISAKEATELLKGGC